MASFDVARLLIIADTASRLRRPGSNRGCASPGSAAGGALDPAGYGGERLVELRGILAPGLREIGPAAAATAHERGHFLDELARGEALGQVLGDRGDQVD